MNELQNNPTCYILVGVPGVGKSTWIKNQSFNWDNTVVASTDVFVEEYAVKQNKTYNEVYNEFMPTAVSLMAKCVNSAVRNKKDIIWDQTSVSVGSRKKKLKMLTSDYLKIAVVFSLPDPDEHKRRLDRPGKSIPEEVLNNMIKTFVLPTISEGFDSIVHI